MSDSVPKPKSTNKTVNRRQFLGDTLKTVSAVGLLGAGLVSYSKQASSFPSWAIRPPGAINEEDFSGACVRCGLCVRDCPYDTLKLSELGEQVETGTPYFVARDVPCEMCDDIPCVVACPSGALDHNLTEIDKSHMGLAVVVDQETCIAFLGLRCEVCFNVCPVQGKAITVEMTHDARSGKHAKFIPVVHSSDCTGCGKCEHACILDDAAIKVFPEHLAKGTLGKHYRLGWEEKESLGKSLVTPDVKHEYNLPEGMEYKLNDGGLSFKDKSSEAKAIKQAKKDESEADVPFSSNPLDTLNSFKLGNE